MSYIFSLLANIFLLLQLLLVIYFITSFFPIAPGGFIAQVRGILGQLFEPVLHKLRKYIPPAGILDLSGIVLIFAIMILRTVFLSLAN